jgi:hypothetical protein
VATDTISDPWLTAAKQSAPESGGDPWLAAVQEQDRPLSDEELREFESFQPMPLGPGQGGEMVDPSDYPREKIKQDDVMRIGPLTAENRPPVTLGQKVKDFFIGDPLSRPTIPEDLSPGQKLRSRISMGLKGPTRVALKGAHGMMLGTPEIGWAVIKRLVPADAPIQGMTLDQALNWAMDYDPSGFSNLAADLAEFSGGVRTAGKLIPGGGAIRTGAKFGAAKAGREISKGIAGRIDPDTKQDYEGGAGVLVDTAAGVIFSAAGTGLKKVMDTPTGKAVMKDIIRRFPRITDKLMKDPSKITEKRVLDIVAKEGVDVTKLNATERAAWRHVARWIENNPKTDIVTRGVRAVKPGTARLPKAEIVPKAPPQQPITPKTTKVPTIEPRKPLITPVAKVGAEVAKAKKALTVAQKLANQGKKSVFVQGGKVFLKKPEGDFTEIKPKQQRANELLSMGKKEFPTEFAHIKRVRVVSKSKLDKIRKEKGLDYGGDKDKMGFAVPADGAIYLNEDFLNPEKYPEGFAFLMGHEAFHVGTETGIGKLGEGRADAFGHKFAKKAKPEGDFTEIKPVTKAEIIPKQPEIITKPAEIIPKPAEIIPKKHSSDKIGKVKPEPLQSDATSKEATLKVEREAKTLLPIEVNANDIDFKTATRAYNNLSHYPERAAYIQQRDYLKAMSNAYIDLKKLAKTDADKEIIKESMAVIKDGYIKRQNDILARKTNTASAFITGPANFPTARMDKRNEMVHRKVDELYNWIEKITDNARKKISDAAIEAAGGKVEVMRKKLAAAEKRQDVMKKINAISRKSKTSKAEKIKQIVDQTDFTEKQATDLIETEVNGKPFRTFELTNNRANVKRMKQRLSDMETAESRSGKKLIGKFEGGEIYNNFDAERVQIIFDGKPDDATRTALKKRGFRWSPKNNAWQRQNTNNALYATKEIAKEWPGFERIAPKSEQVSTKLVGEKGKLDRAIDFLEKEIADSSREVIGVLRGKTPLNNNILNILEKAIKDSPGVSNAEDIAGISNRLLQRAHNEEEVVIPELVAATKKLESLIKKQRQQVTELMEGPKPKKKPKSTGKGLRPGKVMIPGKEDFKQAVKDIQTATGKLLQVSGIEPAKIVDMKLGKDVTAEVLTAIHGKDVAAVEFDTKRLGGIDDNLRQMAEKFDKLPKKVLDDIMLTRGHGLKGEARSIQKAAFARLPKEFKDPAVRRTIDKIADFNYSRLQQLAGDDINKIEDYFYGIYKKPNLVKQFLKYWKSTDRYMKEKAFPTYADAKAHGLDVRDPNPINNLKAEFLHIAHRQAMVDLRDSLLKVGQYIKEVDKAPMNWLPIGDRVFDGYRVQPDLANLINNLISTNKVSQYWGPNMIRKVNNLLRTVKFMGSAFHQLVIAKQSVADSGYLGFYKRTALKGVTAGFKADDPAFTTLEYKDYVRHGGGHHYSLESQAQRALSETIAKFNKSGKLLTKVLGFPIKIPTGYVKWMFNSYIPRVKYSAYEFQRVEMEKKLGRSLKSAEKIEIIKEQQNLYGEMNERLFGRSGTMTSAMRFMFMAPGFAEGNMRTVLKAGMQKGAGKSRSNIINSLLLTAGLATVGTLFMTGKPPKMPERREDVKDLFSIDTGKVDAKGRKIMISLLTYDKDYWEIYGNLFTGQKGKATKAMFHRLGGMTSTVWQVATDMNNIMMGKAVYDWKENRVTEVTDPFLQKVLKLSWHELNRAAPISASVYATARRKGAGRALAAAQALIGVRPTYTEADRRVMDTMSKMWSLRDQREKMYYELSRAKDPRKLVDQYNKTLSNILDNAIIPESLKTEQRKKMYLDLDRYLQNKAHTASMSADNKTVDKAVKVLKNFGISGEQAEKMLREYYSRPKTKRKYNPLESDRVIGRARKRRRLQDRLK